MDCRAFGLSLIVFLSVAATALGEDGAPKFETRVIEISGKRVTVEVADDDERRAYGLMNRSRLAEDRGMLFVFQTEERRAFWMKNTRIPLSIGYFDKSRTLREIINMYPQPITVMQPKTYPSRTEAQYALEMNMGWFEKNKIRTGASFRYADTKVGAH